MFKQIKIALPEYRLEIVHEISSKDCEIYMIYSKDTDSYKILHCKLAEKNIYEGMVTKDLNILNYIYKIESLSYAMMNTLDYEIDDLNESTLQINKEIWTHFVYDNGHFCWPDLYEIHLNEQSIIQYKFQLDKLVIIMRKIYKINQ